MLTAGSLVDGEVIGNGVMLDSAARHRLVAAVAERLAAGVEPGALADELGGELPPGVDPVTVLLDCVRQTQPDGVVGAADDDGPHTRVPTVPTAAPAVGSAVDLLQVLADAVHEATGQTIDRELAGKGVAMVLRRKDGTLRDVHDPAGYLRTAVETAPTRFLPSMVPPAASSSGRPRRESGRERTRRILDEEMARATASGPAGHPSKLVCLTHPAAMFRPDGTCPECRPDATRTAEPGWTGWMSTPPPRTASTGVPPWCGSCGGDMGHAPAVLQANVSFRTDTGRPGGVPCTRCHPKAARASA
ncbi:hypothetical protein [Frankia sp. CiP1_Cm_nod2]|uniref:hypothetical protein n=1 Tax=Frankia sp. CiP1_Cm_nod2 TaxID=2897161 RepID=UPI0020256C04